jgi:hypothetical protein
MDEGVGGKRGNSTCESINFLLSVVGGEGDPKTGGSLSDGRGPDGLDQEAFVEKLKGCVDGELVWADDDGENGRGRRRCRQAEERAELVCVVEETLSKGVSLGGIENSERSIGGCGYRDRKSSGIDEAAGSVEEKGAKVCGSSGKSPACSDGLAQGAYQDIGLDPEVRGEAMAIWADGAEGMGFVDDECGLVSGCDRGEGVERRYIAIHAE